MRDFGRLAKIYIDFGHHPGKDRIPREMAACGCIVITGNEGTSASDVDVPVGPRKFKQHDGQYDYVDIKNQIRNDLDNYLSGLLDEHQTRYRMNIRGEKNDVYSDVQNMVNVIQSSVL
jgi:disulfide oxidoreductase YuzD